jgi:hypothetical protein
MFNSERFQQLTSGFQNIVITIAVVVGGMWTLFTFQALKTREKAKLDLEIAQYRRAALDVIIKAEYVDQSESAPHPQSHFIVATVQLVNRGTVHTEVNVNSEPLIVQRFEDSAQGPRPVEHGAFQPLGDQGTGSVIRPNSTAEYTYLIPVSGPGIYLLSFRATADERSTIDLGLDVTKPQVARVVWSADKVVVAPTPGVVASATDTRAQRK